MEIGNWKNHTLVNCALCHKPMGYHVTTTSALCNDCDRAEQVRIYMTVTRHRLKKQYENERVKQ